MIDGRANSDATIDFRAGELLSDRTRVVNAIIVSPTSKDMGHPVGLHAAGVKSYLHPTWPGAGVDAVIRA